MAIEQLLQSRGLDPRTAALIQMREAAEVLQKSANPMTPSGQPTIASQDVQQALAMGQPQQPMGQPGMQALMPGVQQAARQSMPPSPQQMAQMLQQMQQGQQPAGGGIASLPADVNMAEGGIVGYNGEEDSFIKRLPEGAWLRKISEWIAAGRPSLDKPLLDLTEEKPVPAPAADTGGSANAATRQGKSGIAEQDIGEVARSVAPPPRPSAPPAVSQAVQRPATAATLPIQQLLEERKKERESLEALLSPLMKKKEPSAEELAFVKAQQESADRARQQLISQEQRYAELERQRAEAGKVSGLEDLANFLVRAGGARSLFAGLGQAARGQAEIEAGRRKEAQAAIDRRQQYMDLVDQRRDALEQRDLAIRQGQMERARAAQDQADAATRAMAQLQATIGVHSMGDIAKLLSTQTEVEGRKATHGMPTYSDLEAKRAMQDWMAKNPGKTISDAMDWWASRGKGLDIKESTVGLRALKEEQDQLIKRLETTFGPERDRINARLNQINQERVKLMGGSAAPTTGAPPIGTVMQGYRFKGGNPADRNNWEKV